MKNILVAFLFLAAIPAFADNSSGFRRNTVFCYYRNSVTGYSSGAGGTSVGQAKSRALRACQEQTNDAPHGTCTFLGCKSVR